MNSAKPRLCPLIAFDQIVGGKYKLRILWLLSKGQTRYGEIQRSLVLACQGKAVTPRILSRELKELAARGLIQRTQFQQMPPRVKYALTDAGATVGPIMDEIIRWGLAGHHEAIMHHGVSGRAAGAQSTTAL